jgi:hypothetical protein
MTDGWNDSSMPDAKIIRKDKLKSLSFIPEQGLGQVQGSGRR